ncbi:MAG TPA: glycosyltransferase [Acidimicrobiales bacterium]|nr:glycosyltransferase [Acidimicrobiales bacterium]
MRVLFTFAGGAGHAEPLLPLARAAAARGHVVAITGRSWVTATLAVPGLTVLPEPRPSGEPPVRTPWRPFSAEREEAALRDGFADRIARVRAAGLLEICAGWRPDVVVRDELDFGSAVAAEALGLPRATVLVTAAGFVRPDVVAGPLDRLRAEHGLHPDPHLGALDLDLVLSPFPPTLRDPAVALGRRARAVRLGPAGAGRSPVPDGRPTVVVTLGTVFTLESGNLLARLVAGVRDLGVNVVVTVGHHVDPADLGPQPPHVVVERYVPISDLLADADLVISHGGSGTVTAALAHGLPSVLVPMGADQFLNAARGETLGFARTVDAWSVDPASIRRDVTVVLDDPRYRRAAAVLQAEIDALPGPDHAVDLLEAVADGPARATN